MFRPAGFRPFLGLPLSSITDRAVPLADVFGESAAIVAAEIEMARDGAEMAAIADRFLAQRCPPGRVPSEETTELVEHIAANPALARVDKLAADNGTSVRRLQRVFGDHVGVSPKPVVRRYRFYQVAERARSGDDIDWAALAAELGYSDQSHLSRDFSRTVGVPPGVYARNQPHGYFAPR